MAENIYHIVYKTTIHETGEYYIGKHTTKNLFDGYIGSGKSLINRINNGMTFSYEIIVYADNESIAYEIEKKLVGDKWIQDDLCLNRCAGGRRGYTNNRKNKKMSAEWKKNISKANSKPKTGKALEASIKNAKKGAMSRKGMKDTTQVKEKRAQSVSKSLKGKVFKHMTTEVICDDIRFNSMNEAADYFKITRQTVNNRVKSDKWNWHYG